MRFLIFFCGLMVVFVHCGYPVSDSYPTPPPLYTTAKQYPVALTYKPAPVESEVKPTNSAVAAPSAEVSKFFSDEDNAAEDSASPSESRKRAKARTAHNRHYLHRELQPIKRFQQKQ